VPAGDPQVGVAADGIATVAWASDFDLVDTRDIVRARRIAQNGAVDPATHDLSEPAPSANAWGVTVGPDGVATVGWVRSDSDDTVQARRIAADGTPEAVTDDISDPEESGENLTVTGGAHGAVGIGWERSDTDPRIGRVALFTELAVSLAPRALSFGSVKVGSRASRTFTLTNAGSAPLTISSLALAGANAGQFSLAGTGTCTVAPVTPAGNCQVSAAFAPTSTGAKAAQLVVASDAASGAGTALLTGIGISNAFKLGKLRLNRRTGTARLRVRVPGPGRLSLGGKGVRALARAVRSADTVGLLIRPRRKARRKLNRTGRAQVTARVTYKPAGGTAVSRFRPLTLRKILAR
jgi:hypothetical protein